ncbi:MAG: TIGR02099 family protein [Gammaproteobacteria bacterium]|nr:TIGR02099 family protein [Gammaproteobacteria bacterium]
MKSLLLRLVRGLFALCASLVIVLALMVGLFRLLVPQVPEYQNELEAWATQALGVPVSVGRMDARLTLAGPELMLFDATVGGGGSAMLPLQAREVSVVLSVRRLITERALMVDRVRLAGVVLDLARDEAGEWIFQGQPLMLTDADTSNELPELPDFRLDFEDGELRYSPHPDAGLLRFTDIDLRLERDGARVTLDAQLGLPAALGQRLTVSVEARPGDGRLVRERLQVMPWTLYAEIQGGDVGGWASLLPMLDTLPQAGRGDVQAWFSLQGRQLFEASADVALADVRLPQAHRQGASDPGYERLAARLEWQQRADGWTVAASDLEVIRGGHRWPSSRLRADVSEDTDGGQRIALTAGYLRLQDLLPGVDWLADDALRERLLAMSPRGELTDLSVKLLRHAQTPLDYEVSGRLGALTILPVDESPGIAGLSGRFRAETAGGRFELVSEALAFERRPSFAEAVSLGRAQGLLVWRRSGAAWRLVGDDLRISGVDLTARGSFEMLLPDSGEPELDLSAEVIRADLGAAHRFLPVGHMPEPAVRWLRRGFPSGELFDGRVEIAGPLGEFPFEAGQGRFVAEAQLRDTTLDYADNWPVVTGIGADVRFEGAGLSGSVQRGVIAGSRLRRAEVAIDNLRRPTLSVDGDVDSDVQRLLRFLRDSPAGQPLGEAVFAARGQGPARVRLALELPLFDIERNRWRGTVDLQDVRAGFGEFEHEVADLRGRILLDTGQVSSEDLVGTFLGDVFTAELSAADEQRYHTQLRARGRITSGNLTSRLAVPQAVRLLGASEWSLTGLFPQRQEDGTLPPLSFTLDSALQGMEIGLPAPVGKLAGATVPLRLGVSVDEARGVQVDGALGERLHWRLLLEDEAAGVRLARGQLQIGGEPAILPSAPGLFIDGHIDVLQLDEWLAIAGELAQAADRPLLQRVTLRADLAGGLGQQVADLDLKLVRELNAWQLRLDSEAVAGDVTVPFDPAGTEPLVMDMQRLALAGRGLLADAVPEPGAAVVEAGVEPDPRALPAMRVTADAFALAGMQLGRLEAVLERTPGGLVATQLMTRAESFTIEGDGSWTRAEGGGTSDTRLVLRFTASDVAKALDKLGFEPFMAASAAQVEAGLQWRGPPFSADWRNSVNGEIALDIGNGRLSEVEPGAGRVVGLMSLSALPRRLALDFRDVFGRGLSFDRIDGDFVVIDGDAYTDNLRLRGASADIALMGRTGLATRDYEQQALVSADVGMALPAVGGLLAGPAVAAAILVFQELFRQPMRGMGQVAYCVTGPWEAPVVQRITQAQTEEGRLCIALPPSAALQP